MCIKKEKELEDFKGNPIECNIMDSPVKSNDFKPNQCLLNAYKASKIKGDLIVEGVLIILENGKVSAIVPHCWNKDIRKNFYYDVTKDYIWASAEWIKSHPEITDNTYTYKHLYCFEASSVDYNNKGEISLKYKYDYLIDFIKNKLMITMQNSSLI